MSGRRTKQKVMQILAGKDRDLIRSQLAEMDIKDVLHGLFSGICSSDENVHWNSVTVMGTVVARLAEQDMEEARIVMRRLLWSLNDESGGIGWGAPETMAEIMVHHNGLADEYIHMLISYMREDGDELFQDGNYLELEILQRGLLWGIARLAETKPDILVQRGVVKDLLPYLQSNDAAVRGLAAKRLGLLGAQEALGELQMMRQDNEIVRFLDSGEICSVRVAALAVQAVENISAQGAG